MSKRGAEKQLTDRDWDRDDDNDDEGSETGTFATAPPEVIQTRKIRGLPQRKTAAVTAPSPAEPPKSAFSGFAGFGPLATSSPTPSPPASPSAQNPFAFPSTASATAPALKNPFANAPSFSFTSPSPSISPKSDPPPHTFPGSGTFSFPQTVKPSPLPPTSSTTSSSSSADPALTYFTSLRSLNIALIEALQKEIDKDPFVNLGAPSGLAQLGVKYDEKRRAIVDVFDKSGAAKAAAVAVNGSAGGKMKVESSPAASSVPVPAFTIPTILTTPPSNAPSPAPAPISTPSPPPSAIKEPEPAPSPKAPTFTLPTVPTTFSFNGNVFKPSTPSSSAPVTGGFVPKAIPVDKNAEKSIFSFPTAPAPAPPKPEPLPIAKIKPPNAPAAPSPLRFGESVSPPSTSPAAEKEKEKSVPPPLGAKKRFSFGEAVAGIIKGDEPATAVSAPEPLKSVPVFGFTPTLPANSTSTSTSSSTPASTPFSFASTPAIPITPVPPPASSTKVSSSPPIASGWASSKTPPSFGFGAALGKPPPASSTTPGFGFGSGVAAPASVGFGFGSGATSTSPSVGFGFGSSTSSPFGGTSSPFGGGDSKSPAFSFGSSAPAKTTVGFNFGSSSSTPTASPLGGTPFGSGTSTPVVTTPAVEEEGAGDEAALPAKPAASDADKDAGTMIYEVKGRVVELKGAEESEVGVLVIKVLKDDASGKFRLIGRDLTVNATPKLNFWIPSGLKVTIISKTYLSFVGIKDGGPQSYRIRVKNEPMAKEFKKVLEESAPSS